MRISVNDTVLYFDTEGSGLVPDGAALRERPVILALHGGPGFDHAYFKPALAVLSDVAQIVYLDLRGQGRSGRPAVESCTLEQMADDVAAFCRMLHLERPIVLGHSAGGFVGLHLALRHPDVVGGLILVNTSSATADMGDTMGRLEERHGSEARVAGERVFGGDFSAEAMEAFGRLVLPAYVYDPATSGPVFEALGRCGFSPDVATFYFQERAPLYDLRDQLGEIDVPVLVMVGESDWLCAPSASQTIAGGIPWARLIVIPEAGHFSFAEQPRVFADAVHEWLSARTSQLPQSSDTPAAVRVAS